MKDTLQILTVITATFLTMFITSFLFSWCWIMDHWIRQLLVVLLIFVELVHGVLIYLVVGKKLKK